MKRFLILIALTLCAVTTKAQLDASGYNTCAYAGVNAVSLNPALLPGSPVKTDLIFMGINTAFGNNYLGLKSSAFKRSYDVYNQRDGFYAFKDPDFFTKYVNERPSARDKFVFFKTNIYLPFFNFASSIDEKSSYAVTLNSRTYVNIDGISPSTAKLILNGLDFPQFWNIDITNKNLSIAANSWAELGFTYARKVYENGDHSINFGITPKILSGFGSAYMNIKDFRFAVHADSLISLFNSNVSYGHSTNFNFNNDIMKYNFSANMGFGGNVGVVWEWKPHSAISELDAEGTHGHHSNLDNYKGYKARFGLALVDFGKMTYNKGERSQDFIANINFWDIKDLEFPDGVQSFDDTLRKLFQAQSGNQGKYSVNLPTTLNFTADYQIVKRVYVNLAGAYAFKFPNKTARIHEISQIILTPRYESKFLGLYFPIGMQQYGVLNYGAGLRLGPIVMGTTNLTPLFRKDHDFLNMDMYLLLKIPIVGEEKAKEKYIMVTTPIGSMEDEVEQLPDRDKDGTPDSRDECPDTPGPKALKGCPDRDGDMIPDIKDACPDNAGPKEYNGCPDRDGDKIIDRDDRCPDEPGIPEFFGCPYKDTDKDGLRDEEDVCPNEPGPKENRGCPYSDRDKDGVPDKDDDCPNTPGPVENKGCPYIKKEEQAILDKAFANLEFETGKDIIRKTSFGSLDELAGLLKFHGEWILKLSGHTDNQGTADKNLILSKKRTIAVQKYLQKKGAKNKIITEWFGQTMPIGDNNTPEGRQKNRRVEMKVLFK